jgi:multidrug efflux pump subunit AcrB
MRGFNLSDWAVRHPAFILFLIIGLMIGGTAAFLQLGRSEDPNFTIKTVVVTAAWPGATAIEMTEQVADRIEKELQELPSFDNVLTQASPGFVAMEATFRDDTPPGKVPDLLYLARKKVDDVRPQLPQGVVGVSVNDEFGDTDSILFMLTADGASFAEKKRVAEALKRVLLRVPDVVKVNLHGVQDERVFVEFSPTRLAALGVPVQAFVESVARSNAVTSAGSVDTGASRVPLRVSGALGGAQAVAETPVEANGRTFRLGDIATVTRGYEDPARFLVRQRGDEAIGIGLVMQQGGNILTLGAAVDEAVAGFLRDLPVGFTLEKIADQPRIVDEAIWEFEKVFLEALAIVLAVSFVALGWRSGIVVALSVPLVLAATFIIMLVLGIDLHRISLGALIIALGLLVDDAIIAIEMMIVKMEEGWDRMRAAAYAWTSTAFPMLTGTLIMAAGFIPVGFASSATAEFTNAIFWVVAIALLVSWVVAVMFVPYLGVKLLPAKVGHGHGDPYQGRAYRALRATVRFCVRFRLLVVLATLVVFVGSVVLFTRVPQQFFPLSERTELFVQIRMPEGTAIGVTSQVARKAEGLLARDAEVGNFTTYVGAGSPRFWLGLNPAQPNPAYAEIVVTSADVASRERIKARIEAAVAEGALNEARVRVERFTFGPPVGFPVQFRVFGPGPAETRALAERVRDIMRDNPDARDPHLAWNELTPSLHVSVDEDRARALGFNPQDVAITLQTFLSGVPVTTIRDGTERVEVVARAVAAERSDLGRIGDLTLTSRSGAPVPITQLARLESRHENAILWRRNRELFIAVRADARDGVQPAVVSAAIRPAIDTLLATLPPGHRVETGGTVEESDKGNAAINAMMPLMVAAMLFLIMMQVQSLPRLALVFSTAPLGIIGAAWALTLTGAPFGFVALLGLIALAGMIMRNTIVLVDQIEHDVTEGATLADAIVEATVRRARPVILTALAAVLAMIPIATSAFWGPMAITIGGGLLVATALTILFLPALYALAFRKRLHVKPAPEAAPVPAEVAAPAPAPLRLAAE